jgi:drug/metabolite transporter (DMT)-like permease
LNSDKPLDRPAPRADILRVVAWTGGALLGFSAMAVSVRELAAVLNIFETMVLRNSFGVVVLSLLAIANPALRMQIRRRYLATHLLRNGTHYVAQASWMVAITLLPLATVFALEFSMPIWVGLFAVLFLGERMTFNRLLTLILGFAGVCIIVRPGMASFQPAAIYALAAAFGYAIAAVVTKHLTRDESTFAILFWMNVIQLPLGLAGSEAGFLGPLGSEQALAVAGVVIAGLLSHFCLTNAFRAGDALIVIPLDFMRVPLIALIGWTLYGESLDVLVFVGTGLIMAGVLWGLWQEARPGKG